MQSKVSFIPLEPLLSGAAQLGVCLSQHQLDQLDRFASFLVDTNRRFNLTRITQPEEIVTQHYLDSLTCLSAAEFPPDSRVIDVGTGAGMPGIPIKIARPDLSIAFLDSTRKKLDFISLAVEALGLDKTEIIHARAEDAGRDPLYRERFDTALARALAPMKVTAELCLPLVRVGGKLIAQKSDSVDGEIADARALIGTLGGELENTFRVNIPHTRIVRRLVVVGKRVECPKEFPRPYARIVRDKRGRGRGGDAADR